MVRIHKKKEIIQGIVAIVFFLAMLWFGATLIDMDNIKSKVGNTGISGMLAFILLKASTIIIAPLGGSPFYLSAAPLFGFGKGFALLFIGDMLGYTVAFWIARVYGQKVLRWILSDSQFERTETIMDKIATWKGFAILRMVFLGLGDALSYAVGLTRLPFWQYLIITLLAVLTNIVIMMFLGASFITSASNYVTVLIMVTVLPAVLYWFWKKLNRKKTQA